MIPVVLGIDPGNSTGWAILGEGTLIACGATGIDSLTTVPIPQGAHLIIEVPEIYPKSPVPPNDLITLAVTAGRWIERCTWYKCHVRKVHPKEWKGQTPKKVHNKRVLAALTPYERALVPHLAKDDDMIDAIGLALFAVGRIRVG